MGQVTDLGGAQGHSICHMPDPEQAPYWSAAQTEGLAGESSPACVLLPVEATLPVSSAEMQRRLDQASGLGQALPATLVGGAGSTGGTSSRFKGTQ